MPNWVSGQGFSPPQAKGSPETAYSLSSSISDNRRLVAVDSGSGMAGEGLDLATRGSLRESSACSGGSRSNGSMPALMDASARERSPRKSEPIEDISDRPYGALRSRGRDSSPLAIADQREGGQDEV